MTDNEIYLMLLALICFIIAVAMNEWRSRDRTELLSLRIAQKKHDGELAQALNCTYDANLRTDNAKQEARRHKEDAEFYRAELDKLGWEPPVTHHSHPDYKINRRRSEIKADNGLDPFGVTGGTGIGPFGGLGGYGF